MIQISSGQLEEIKRCGEETYPHECCGLLLGCEDGDGKRRIERVVAASNVHEEDHSRRYLISPEEMLAHQRMAREANQEILGFFHSHPDVAARPSRYDRDQAWPWYTYVIVSVVGGSVDPELSGKAAEVTAWRLAEDRGELVPEEIALQESEARSQKSESREMSNGVVTHSKP